MTGRFLAFLLAALMASAPCPAMQVNPDGVGEVLIYPYFTAQESEGNAFNTYVSVVNDARFGAKALRVRFREGRDGRELGSFNLLLGPRDTWTGAVVPTPEGARLVTTDQSCTSPGPLSALEFRPSNFLVDDGLGLDVARFREGYVEIFEMASLDSAPSCAAFQASTLPTPSLLRPSGGLSGTLTLINVESGLDFTVNPVALSDFATAAYFRAPSDPYPDYDSAEVAPVASFYFGDDRLYRTTWDSSVQAVNVVLMAGYIDNEVVMDRGTLSRTDFVVTMPTRRLAGNAPPFRTTPSDSRNLPFSVGFQPRDGLGTYIADECSFICRQGERVHLPFQWSASVVSFRASGSDTESAGAAGISDVLGSRNGWLVDIPTTAQNGWIAIGMDGLGVEATYPILHERIYLGDGTVVPARPTYFGLPVVGFMVRTFSNGTLACQGAACQGNYGGAFAHRYRRAAYPL